MNPADPETALMAFGLNYSDSILWILSSDSNWPGI